eukprot:1470528-Amphidinium_carterae.2
MFSTYEATEQQLYWSLVAYPRAADHHLIPFAFKCRCIGEQECKQHETLHLLSIIDCNKAPSKSKSSAKQGPPTSFYHPQVILGSGRDCNQDV